MLPECLISDSLIYLLAIICVARGMFVPYFQLLSHVNVLGKPLEIHTTCSFEKAESLHGEIKI